LSPEPYQTVEPVDGTPLFVFVEPERDYRRMAKLAAASIGVHLAVLGLLLIIAPLLPEVVPGGQRLVQFRRQITELVAPPRELTQKEPNSGQVSKEMTVESIRPRAARENSLPTPGAAATPALPGKQFKMPEISRGNNVPQTVMPDAPNIDVARVQAPPPGLGTSTNPQIAPPQIQAEEKPKLAFEAPGSNTGVSGQRGVVPIPKPKTGVDEAIRQATHGGTGLRVGDEDSGLEPMPGIRPNPAAGKVGSALELLSDPQGVDFKPYLQRILAAVRRNWMAVIPESARLGRQGKVLVRFTITRDGSLQKFEISMQSGTDALDKAAVAGISASQPFPPLPPEFKAGWIRLQLTFRYNQ
jgi:TonB family protein